MDGVGSDIFSRQAHFHGVKGLLRFDGSIIVLRRDIKAPTAPLQLDLPGGGREARESPYETLRREIFEEFSLTLNENDIVYGKHYAQGGSETGTYFLVTRELDINPNSIVFGDKGLGYGFMTIHDFIHHPDAVKKQKQRIIEYLEYIKESLL
jgi:8-oxo-dGTP diphosphatase